MSDAKRDLGNVAKTLGKLFFGTDKQHNETLARLAEDAAKTVKRVRVKDGAINAIGEAVDDDDESEAPAEAVTRPGRRVRP